MLEGVSKSEKIKTKKKWESWGRERKKERECVCVLEREGGRESIIVCQSGHEKAARIYNRSRLILIDSD